MITFNLNCKTCSSEFEGWFDSTSDYESQKRKKLLLCPSCNSHKIVKSLMAPNLASKSNKQSKKIKKTMINDIKRNT